MRNSPSFFRRLGPWLAALCFLAVHAVPARAQNVSLQTVSSFGPAPDGTAPAAAMVQANDGNFYGTTPTGGANGNGTIYQYNPFTGAYAILHDFTALAVSLNTNADGAGPRAPLIQGQDGSLYGTASYGGAADDGTVFRITTAGVFTTLHSFNGADGSGPKGALFQTSDGTFYGTTNAGDGTAIYGTVFKMTAAGTVTTLHNFTLGSDGGNPAAGLIQGMDGNLYGTASAGGDSGYGALFRITTAGTFTPLHSFNNTDGADPEAPLCAGADGFLYGTTQQGGASSNGTVFKINQGTAFTLLHEFTGGQPESTDGSNPFSGLVQGPDSTFYGTTYAGGSADQHGTLYGITSAGVLQTLYRFTGGNDGSNPNAALTLDRRGDFFGVTSTNGIGGGGTIFLLNIHGILSFGAASANVSENAGGVQVVVNRTGSSAGAVGVTYATEDITAFPGTDFTPTSGTLSWADGDATPRTITIPVIDNHLNDGSTRAFDIALSLPTGGAVLQSPAVENIQILENDAVPAQPTVTLDTPSDDTTTIFTGSTLTIAASVADPGGVLAAVQFTLNGATVGTASAAGPYVFTGMAPTVPGTYPVGVIVTDTLGRVSTATHTITVRAPAATGDPAPDASILTGLDGRAVGVGQTIPISAVAATSDGSPLAEVDFYAGSTVIARLDGTGAPISLAGITGMPRRADVPVPLPNGTVFQTSYLVPGGSKLINLLCVAFSKLGVALVSTPVTIHPVDPSVGQPPAVGLSGLSDGATIQVGVPITLSADVTLPAAAGLASPSRSLRGAHRQDAGSQLADLAFFLNASLVQHATGNLTMPAFTFTPPSAGDYVVEAIATDTNGISGLATPILVHAVGAPTVVTIAPSGDGRAEFGVENGKLTIRRTGSTAAMLTVYYKVKGPAKAGVDFKPLTGMLVIPAGATQAKLKFKPLFNPLNTGTLKAKVMLLPAGDGSYQLGDTTLAKLKVVSGG